MLHAMASIALPGLHGPSASFEVPLEMLAACHLRIEAQCHTLCRLVPHVAAHGSDRAAREAAQALMRYFDQAAPDHHADEERDLFPALLEAMAGSDAVCLRDLVDQLTVQHRELEGHWQALRPVLARIAAGEGATLDDPLVQRLVTAYRQHLAREDAELLPMAARLIGDIPLQQIGRAMRLRRGITHID